MTYKKYLELTSKWTDNEILIIDYETKFSKGRLELSMAFFLEFSKKIKRLLKQCHLRQIYVYDSVNGLYKKVFNSLEEIR